MKLTKITLIKYFLLYLLGNENTEEITKRYVVLCVS